MKHASSIVVACLSLSLVAVVARAEFTVDYPVRKSGATAADAPGLSNAVYQEEVTLEWGDAQLAAAVSANNGTASADQSIGAFVEGQSIRIAGSMHSQVTRTVPWEGDSLDAGSIVSLDFTNPDPFVTHLEYEKTGHYWGSTIRIVDEYSGEDILHVPANDLQGSVTVVLSGFGSYVLRISHVVVSNDPEPRERSGAMHFSLTLAPEGAIPVSDEAWSGVKALYR